MSDCVFSRTVPLKIWGQVLSQDHYWIKPVCWQLAQGFRDILASRGMETCFACPRKIFYLFLFILGTYFILCLCRNCSLNIKGCIYGHVIIGRFFLLQQLQNVYWRKSLSETEGNRKLKKKKKKNWFIIINTFTLRGILKFKSVPDISSTGDHSNTAFVHCLLTIWLKLANI